MTALLAALTWALRLVGLVSAAEKLWAAHQAAQAQQAAANAEKATIHEDERKLAVAAQPDRSPDAILDRMRAGDE